MSMSIDSILHKGTHSARRGCCVLLMLGIAVAPLSLAQAQAHLGPEAAGGTYNVQIMSYWEIPFRSIVRQRYDFSCGSAAVATLLTHQYGTKTAENEPFIAMWQTGDRKTIQKAGFSMLDMKNYLNKRGFKTQGFRMSLDDFRKLDQPAIVLLNLNGYKHFVVVKGVRGDRVLLGDSVRGLTQYSLDDFGKSWNGIILMVMETPDKRVGLFNYAKDWDLWATLLRRDYSRNAPINSITGYLPPQYQITPQIPLGATIPIPQ